MSDDAEPRFQAVMRKRVAADEAARSIAFLEAIIALPVVPPSAGEMLNAAQPTDEIDVRAVRRGLAMDDEPEQHGEAA